MEAPKTQKSSAAKYFDRMQRLKTLQTARQESRTQNHREVVAEDARSKLPSNWESRQQQADWLLSDDAARKAAVEKGDNYDRLKLLNVSAIDADKIERKKSKKNPDLGFSSYEAQTARQYDRLVKNLPPRNMFKYEEQKEKFGAAFYGGPHTIVHGIHKDSTGAIDHMVKDLEQQISKRKGFSRRRTHNDDADIDYINEKNERFNKKMERFYGEHTAEIKQNLERGTAI